LFSAEGEKKMCQSADAYNSTWEFTLDGSKGDTLMTQAKEQAQFLRDAITSSKALSKTDPSLYSTSHEMLGPRLERVGAKAWKQFCDNVTGNYKKTLIGMEETETDFKQSANDHGLRWLDLLYESAIMDMARFKGYVVPAEKGFKEYREGTITLDELDTKLELPEAPVRPDVSHLGPEYSFNSHSEYRKTLSAENSFIEVNDRQIGGYTNASKVDTVGEGTGTTSQLTHRSKTSSRPAKTATTGNRKKTKRGRFTADQLAAEHREDREKEENKPTYAEMLRKSAPTATSETSGGEESKGTDSDPSVVSST
jgi:hypothetical protein